jgi:hypothetical protein
MPLDQLDQYGPTCQILAGPVGPVCPVGPAGPQYVLFNCRWPIKITVRIRAFFFLNEFGHILKKWQGVHLRRNFAILRSFFKREKQDLEI